MIQLRLVYCGKTECKTEGLSEKPDPSGVREKQVSGAKIKIKGVEKRDWTIATETGRNSDCKRNADQRCNQGKKRIRSTHSHDCYQWQKYIGRKRRKTDVIASLINCQFQPGIVLPQIKTTMQPGISLKRVGIIEVFVPWP